VWKLQYCALPAHWWEGKIDRRMFFQVSFVATAENANYVDGKQVRCGPSRCLEGCMTLYW